MIPARQTRCGFAMIAACLLAAATRAAPPSGEQLYDIACLSCHSLGDAADHRVGPPLGGLLNRKAAAVKDYRYSEALSASGWELDAAHLARLALRILMRPYRTTP